MAAACKIPSSAGAVLVEALEAGGARARAVADAVFESCPASGEQLVQLLVRGWWGGWGPGAHGVGPARRCPGPRRPPPAPPRRPPQADHLNPPGQPNFERTKK